jgi:hypothetical protein
LVAPGLGVQAGVGYEEIAGQLGVAHYQAQLCTRRIRPVAGGAHLVTAAELDFWSGPGAAAQLAAIGDRVTHSVRPLQDAGLLDLVPPDHAVAPGIRLLPAAGRRGLAGTARQSAGPGRHGPALGCGGLRASG